MSSADERGKTPPTDDEAKAAARALVDLVRAWHRPRRFRHEPSWHHIAAAFVVRMGDTVESILTLWEADRRSGLDMMILLRALYEQTVVFAWLAIDPDTHLKEWGKPNAITSARGSRRPPSTASPPARRT